MNSRAEKDRRYKERHPDAVKARWRKWQSENRERIRATGARRRLEKRAACLVAGARTRARKRGVPFDLDQHVGDIQKRIDVGRCELTGIVFDLTPGRSFASPSLDRMNPKGGYLYDNIRVVCHAVNAALGDWGVDALQVVIDGWNETASSLKRRRNSSGRI